MCRVFGRRAPDLTSGSRSGTAGWDSAAREKKRVVYTVTHVGSISNVTQNSSLGFLYSTCSVFSAFAETLSFLNGGVILESARERK